MIRGHLSPSSGESDRFQIPYALAAFKPDIAVQNVQQRLLGFAIRWTIMTADD